MRGRKKNPKTLLISGTVYLEIEDQSLIDQASAGDIMLCIDVETPYYQNTGDYSAKGHKGCFRLRIFDGKIWAFLNPGEFFTHKENYFSKNEYPINCFQHCLQLLESFAGNKLFKTYRDHYTLREYEPNDFKGKKGNKFKKADKI